MQNWKMTRNTRRGIKILVSACLQSYLDNGWFYLPLLWQLSTLIPQHLDAVCESVEIEQ